MNLENGGDGGVKVVGLGLSGVSNLDGETTTRDWKRGNMTKKRESDALKGVKGEKGKEQRLTIENGSVVKVLGELLRVESSTGDDESQLRSESSDILMGDRKEDGVLSL